MRFVFTLLALLLLMFAAADAATVSGTVSYLGGGANAASFKKVYLYDSSTATSSIVYTDSTITSVTGSYSFTLPSSITSGRIRVVAVTCTTNYSSYTTFSGSNLTINIQASCLPPAVEDTLRNASSGLAVLGQIVYIRDTAAAGTYIDSSITNYQGLVRFFVPPTVLPGTTLEVYTFACGRQSQFVTYNGSTLAAPNMNVCLSNAVVSGVVTNGNTTTPVGLQKVNLIDSSGGNIIYSDSTYTASGTGAYSFTIPLRITGGKMIASTQACGQRYSNNSTFSGSNVSLNMAVCTGVSATISGVVTYAANPGGAASFKKVYLVDSSTITNSVIFRDSAITSVTGAYSIPVPSAVTSGTMRIWVNSCGWSWSSGSSSFNGTSQTINLSLGCSPPNVLDTVKDVYSGRPVIGKKIYLLDSGATNYYLDSMYTGQGGLGSFNIPAQVAPGTLKIYTYSCGTRITQPFTYTSGYDVAPTLVICDSNAIISGTVTNAVTNAPIAYQKVRIMDSSATSLLFLDSVYTNGSGVYSIGVPLTLSGGTMIANVYSCGLVHRNSAPFNGGNLTLNLAVCASNASTISGTVTNSSTNAAIAGRKVYLVDSSTTTSSIVYRDSTVTGSNGGYSFNIAAGITSGFFKISVPTCVGALSTQSGMYTGNSLTMNFSVCGNTGPAVLSGTIYVGGQGYVAGTKVTVHYFYPYQAISTTTNSSGFYSITLPSSWAASSLTWGDSSSCGMNLFSLPYSQASLTRSDTLCPVRTIGGTVTLQGGGPAAGAKVYLIVQDTLQVPVYDTTLTAVDSTFTNSAGQYSFSRPNGLYSNTQLVKAMLMPSHPAYSSYLPSYHDSALMWRNAQHFSYNEWAWGSTTINISLRGGVNPGGPGFIGGTVSLGANKNVGDPLEDRLVLLTTASGRAVAYTHSDASGRFAFPNLAYGTYVLFGDVWGKDNPGLTVTLSAASPSVGNVQFDENDSKFEGHVANVGVSATMLSGVSVYPVPARDYVLVTGLNGIKGAKYLALYDLAGKLITAQTVETGSARIGVASLPAGMYQLRIKTEAGSASFQVIK